VGRNVELFRILLAGKPEQLSDGCCFPSVFSV
jgi:hypothetical protein